jgi:nucleotide-binding universal stress UspA family protein
MSEAPAVRTVALTNRPAAVLVAVLARTGARFGFSGSLAEPDAIDGSSEEAARASADDGVALARLEEAEADNADVIVMGSRGLTGVKSFLLGSVSHAVLQHADRPVVVVPSPAVAERRAADRHH